MIKRIRLLHLYLGTFFAPSIIFFALTGAVQTFGLHEGSPGSSYQPPAWIERLAQIHKKQTMEEPRRRPPSGERKERGPEGRPPGEPGGPGNPPGNSASTWALKSFVFLMAIGLTTTTFLGIYMAFAYNRDRRLVWGLLIAGAVLPVVLLFV